MTFIKRKFSSKTKQFGIEFNILEKVAYIKPTIKYSLYIYYGSGMFVFNW